MAAAAKKLGDGRSDRRNNHGQSLWPKVNSGWRLRKRQQSPPAPLLPEQVTSLVDRVRLHIERGQFALAVAVCLQAWDEAQELETLRTQNMRAGVAEVLFGEHEAVIEACVHLGIRTIEELLDCKPKRLLAEPGVSPDRLRAVVKELRNFLTDNEFDLLVRERSTEAAQLDSQVDAQSENGT